MPGIQDTSEIAQIFCAPVARWFASAFEAPSRAQSMVWPAIASGRDVLLTAPTGSGKTLAGFLVAIDRLARLRMEGSLPAAIDTVYISPLRALTADIKSNLEAPLAGIAELLDEAAGSGPPLRAGLRTGDSTAAERARLLRDPPHILATTPESLYLLLTSVRGAQALSAVRTVIVDEVHALMPDRRGTHLSLSLERLDRLVARSGGTRPQRIGLSATMRPLQEAARWLSGSAPGSKPAAIVDASFARSLDIRVALPSSEELCAVASTEWWESLADCIANLAAPLRSTLVFVNTRRLAERLAFRLGERMGEDSVAAHHGSLSKAERGRAEDGLRQGRLKLLVATSSMELGIDVGHLDLVCQIASPRSLSGLVQRIGRSGHGIGRTPKGILFPTSRDELLECAAAVFAARSGVCDRLQTGRGVLDVLAQQVAAIASEGPVAADDLFHLVRGAAPYAQLARSDFDAVVDMLARGLETPRGTRGRLLSIDGETREIRARRGARLTALTCGGTIAETGEFRVVLDQDETFLGTVHEDWAIESSPGDIFSLGHHSWRIKRVEQGRVRVVDAEGAPPTFPFWIAEAPARSDALSEAVGSLRAGLAADLESGADSTPWLLSRCGLDAEAAAQLIRYVKVQRDSTGVVPTQSQVLVERFFDESGGQQLVVHAPFGARVNRGLGLLLRKRFCRAFNQELQAAATDDAIVLSLGNPQTFPLEEFPRFLAGASALDSLAQAFLGTPLFGTRMRWNFGRSLILKRFRNGRPVPFPLLRMEGDDLLAAAFPDQASCQEHVAYPIPIPDHPVVRQSIEDCLEEVADASRLLDVLDRMRGGAIEIRTIDTTEPSVFSHEILGARPFAFLDDAPLEERRTRAVAVRRSLPEAARDLGRLDPGAIAAVREEAQPEIRSVDELIDLLDDLLFLPAEEPGVFPELLGRRGLIADALASGRVVAVQPAGRPAIALRSRLSDLAALLPDAAPLDPARAATSSPGAASVADQILRHYAACLGPFVLEDLSAWLGIPMDALSESAVRLQVRGVLLGGRFDPGDPRPQWCDRRLLARIHRRTLEGLRRLIEPASPEAAMRFLLRWQHVHPENRRAGESGLLDVVARLSGWHAPVRAFEESILPARMIRYEPRMLDALCQAGEVRWGRFRIDQVGEQARSHGQTPVALHAGDLPAWYRDGRDTGDAPAGLRGEAVRALEVLRERGALFRREIERIAGLLPAQVEEALRSLTARGLATCDGFAPLRRLLRKGGKGRSGAAVRSGAPVRGDGRWSLLAFPDSESPQADAMQIARQLLDRYGVVFRDLLVREWIPVGWRRLRLAFSRLEDRGEVRGGRFVSGATGEQFALPAAVERLRSERNSPPSGEHHRLSVHDPLNLQGVLLPAAAKAPGRERFVHLLDGRPLPDDAAQRS